jgi:penicillin-binding protein 2
MKELNNKLRFNLLYIIVYVSGIILLAGLFNLQIVKGNDYRKISNTRLSRNMTVKASRGDILDSSGNKLISTKMLYNLEFYKTKIDNATLNKTLLLIAQTLDNNGDKYIDQFPITINPTKYNGNDFSVFKKSNNLSETLDVDGVYTYYLNKYKITEENADNARKILTLRYAIEKSGYSSTRSITLANNISIGSRDTFNVMSSNFPGVSTANEPTTNYNYGEMASHILGYIQRINAEELKSNSDYNMNDKIGKTGIEKVFEKYLRGKDGIKQIDMSVDGIVTGESIVKEAVSGSDVVLTLDSQLQKITEETLAKGIVNIQNTKDAKDASEGAAVVLNVQTGEVLAMASYPNYNPALFTNGISSEDYQKYINDKRHPFINKAISDKSAPGSIFKMVTAIAALESNQISINDKINDTYRYTFYRDYQPTCWKPGGHGLLNITQAIEVSCNFFFYEIGRRAGIAKIDEVAKKLGLGSKTGIELPDEIAGTLAGPEVDKQWTGGKTIQTAIGQSYNDYTPLQMAKYTAMIANGGKNIDVTIVKSINNPDGTTVSRNELDSYIHNKLGVETNSGSDLNISSTDLEAVKNGMKNVTSDESGTAYKYFKDFSISIGGKTGSASIGNSGHANAWFVGFGPFENPKIAVAVYVKRGEHGSYTAPIARDIFAQYFGMNAVEIKEDMSVNSQMMSIR